MSLCDHGYDEAHTVRERVKPEDVGASSTSDPSGTIEMFWKCPGPVVNIAFRPVDEDRPGHVEVDIFIGRRHTGRGRAGRVMMRSDEWAEIRDRILSGEIIELGITS